MTSSAVPSKGSSSSSASSKYPNYIQEYEKCVEFIREYKDQNGELGRCMSGMGWDGMGWDETTAVMSMCLCIDEIDTPTLHYFSNNPYTNIPVPTLPFPILSSSMISFK
jgi:hypothetical protein